MKLKFYQLMILLDQSEANYLAICRHFLAVSNTPIISNDPDKMNEAIRNVVLYIILAPHSNEQSDLIHRINEMKCLDKIPEFKELLSLFIQQEMISWQNEIVKQYQSILRNGTKLAPANGVFGSTDVGNKQWENFQTRVGEHNIRMVSKYYSRISLKRLAELLDWPIDKTETFLCQLIVDGTVQNAKIDRLDGEVKFKRVQSPAEVMDDWSYSISHVMSMMNKACHLMTKEEMVHNHLHNIPV